MNEIIWDESPVPSGDIVWDEPKKQRSILDNLKRSAGLTGRYVVEGAANLFGPVVDPIYQLAGAKPWTQGISDNLTALGVPKPEGAAENISAAVSKGMVGGGGLAGIAKSIPGAMTTMAPLFRGGFGTEIAAQGIGAGASEATKEAGGGFVPQMIAGVVAPMAMGGAVNTVKAAGNAVNELRRPITKAGADQIAADVLGRVVQDKKKAIANLQNYNKLKDSGKAVGVDGSQPFSAAVAGDYGLIGGHQLAARNPTMAPTFSQRGGINNEARAADLAKLNATDAQLEFYAGKRDALTSKLREDAFAAAQGPVNVEPVLDKIFRTFRSHKAQGEESQKALNYLYGRIEKAKAEGALHPQDLYDGLHKDINQMATKGLDSENGRLRLSSGIAMDIKKTLADAIEERAPGFKRYLEKYSRLSKPIDRLEVIKERLGGEGLDKISNAQPQLGSDGATYTLSQAKMRNANKDIAADLSKMNIKLAPRQSDVLSRVQGDLNANTVAAAGGKQPGSDTYQNMASANFMDRVLGKTLAESGAGRMVRAPLNLAMRPLESRISDTVMAAYLDPKEMERLLKLSRTTRDGPTISGLLDYSTPRMTGGLLGSLFQ